MIAALNPQIPNTVVVLGVEEETFWVGRNQSDETTEIFFVAVSRTKLTDPYCRRPT